MSASLTFLALLLFFLRKRSVSFRHLTSRVYCRRTFTHSDLEALWQLVTILTGSLEVLGNVTFFSWTMESVNAVFPLSGLLPRLVFLLFPSLTFPFIFSGTGLTCMFFLGMPFMILPLMRWWKYSGGNVQIRWTHRDGVVRPLFRGNNGNRCFL